MVEWADQPLTEQGRFQLEQSQQKILQRLIALTHNSHEFSFSIMGWLDMGADLKQELLEVTASTARLDRVLEFINQQQ